LQWEDHERYLVDLTEILARVPAKRLIVMGDFNQIIGAGSRASPELQLSLQRAFSPKMTILTSTLTFQGHSSIDHIAVSHDLEVGPMDVISNVHNGRELTDHFGVVASLSSRDYAE